MATSADPEPVTCRREADGLAIVTIDRPERRNVLNLDVKRRLTTIEGSLRLDLDRRLKLEFHRWERLGKTPVPRLV